MDEMCGIEVSASFISTVTEAVSEEDAIYLVKTTAQKDVKHPDVQRKLKAAQAGCERIPC